MSWPDMIQGGLAALRHSAADTGDAEVIRLLARAEAQLRDRPAMPEMRIGSSPVVCPGLRARGAGGTDGLHGHEVRHAIEATTSQLRIELMFPADDAAEAYFRTHQPT